MFVPTISSEPQNILLPNLVCKLMQHHKPECRVEKLVHFVQCRGHSKGIYNQNMTVSVVSSILLVTAKVQNVSGCLADIFWITEHFVTKFGMVMQHLESVSSRSWSQRELR